MFYLNKTSFIVDYQGLINYLMIDLKHWYSVFKLYKQNSI